MSDSALNNAKNIREQLVAKKDELQAQLSLVKQRLAVVEEFIHNYHAFADGSVLESLESENKKDTKREQRVERIKNSPKEEVVKVARAIIKEMGQPVSRKRLLELLDQEGLTIEGENREKVLATMLWRMRDRVVSFKRVGYWLAEVPYGPQNYDPERYFEQLAEEAAEVNSGADE